MEQTIGATNGHEFTRIKKVQQFSSTHWRTGGASWSAVNSGFPYYVTAQAIDPQNPRHDVRGEWLWGIQEHRSWDKLGCRELRLTNLNVQVLLIDPRNPDTVYAGANNGSVFAMTFAPEP
jgi:hypothetical protein